MTEALSEATKSEGGKNFSAGDYAYVPDPEKPSTWKLRLTNTPGGDPDSGIVGAAVAALGKGFRGRTVSIPAADLKKVKAKVRAAWRKANPDKKTADMPEPIAEALSNNETRDQLQSELEELLVNGQQGRYVWIRDFSTAEGWVVYELSGTVDEPGTYKVGFEVGDDDVVDLVGDPVEVIVKAAYVAVPDDTDEAAELLGDVVPLDESALRRDGTVPIKLIEPGWSANGRYYSEDVLDRDGVNAFTAGTHMYWDHPTASEESDRPERSLRDLAAVTISDARYQPDGAAGPGLYADAKVFADYQPVVEELAPHIGVSIRAGGQTSYGEADGQSGEIVERIAVGKSVDFVTTPAAGGEIVSLFESVRAQGPKRKEGPVPPTNSNDLTEVQRELTEANRKLTEATELGTLAAAQRDRYREQLVLREATDAVVGQLTEAKLPDITKKRLVGHVAANPPLTDAGELDTDTLKTRVEEAINAERDYLATLSGSGVVRDFGDTGGIDEADREKHTARLSDAFARMGLSESEAKNAAAGRR